jgi:5-methylcytosine-specific restriction enzyme B
MAKADFDKFKGKIVELQEYLAKDTSILNQFKIDMTSTTKDWVWIKDHFNIIGSKLAHYELTYKYKSNELKIYVDIHFEDDDNRKKQIFYETLKNSIDDKEVKWIEWHKAQSIRYNKSFNIDSPSFMDDIKEALLYLDNNLGDKIRSIMNDLTNPNQTLPMWEKVIKNKYQIILQGAPGTGKTYNAKSLAYQLIFKEPLLEAKREEGLKQLANSEQFALIQFHPAYSYEDFVRGITAKANGSDIEYITENKVLAEFAQRAMAEQLIIDIEQHFKGFVSSVKEQVDKNEEKFFIKGAYIDEVTSDEFKYRGTNSNWTGKFPINDILKMYKAGITRPNQIKINSIIDISSTARHDSTYPIAILDAFRKFLVDKSIPLKNYVLIIDEINRANLPSVLGELIYALEYRGEPVNSMYALDGDNQLILPKNLYIIGTMNTADRSVGHIDYAIRRRFAFLDVLPQLSVVKNEKARKLFEAVAALFCNKYKEQQDGKPTDLEKSEYLAPDFKPEDVMLGHSYFLAKEEETLKFKLEYEIKPILREYLKDGILLETAKQKIKELDV